MTKFKVLKYEDYDSMLDLCKNIWDGNDYIPIVFHKWIDDKNGCFLGIMDNNKLVALGKYSILLDKQGWLEGLRVHPEYRGNGYANKIADKLLSMAEVDLENNIINSIGMCTHIDTPASIKMMSERGFKLDKSCMVVFRDKDTIKNNLSLNTFKYRPWNIDYNELINLDYFKNFDNKIVHGFTYLNLCENVYNELVLSNSLVDINGHKGIIKLKGNTPSIMCIDESIDSINTLFNYCILKYNVDDAEIYITNPTDSLISDLKLNNYESISNFEKDCVYYKYKK